MRRCVSITFAMAAAGAAACAVSATDLTLTGTIGSPQGAPYDVFASDVALANATTLVVGIRGADTVAPSAGSVEVFAWTDEGWDRVARPTFAGLAGGDQLGEAVAACGDWFAVGAPRHDARGSDAGAVMLARKSGSGWSHTATLLPPAGAGAHFGASIAMTAERLAIGAPRAAAGGFVDVYARVGETWSFETRIANPTPSAANRFGESVALGTDASGAPLLVIGDPADDAVLTDAGSARVYGFAAGGWSERAVLTASSTSDRLFFGQSVAVASGVVAVGAYAAAGGNAKEPIEEAGAVEVFAADGDAWSSVAVLTSPNAAAYGSFGWDIALESRVTASGVTWMMLVGEPGAASEGGDTQAGRVHCFRTPALASSPASWESIARARMTPASPQAVFGAALAISSGVSVFAAPGASVSGTPQGLATSLDLSTDCDENGVPDAIDIANGAPDSDGDGVLDVCEPQFDVPGVYSTIQAAIDAVPAGTARTITVAPGIYNEAFALNGKNVVVQGAPDGTTILDGTGLSISIARFTGGEPATAGVENLVFRNGIAGTPINPPNAIFTGGGAVFGKLSSAFIRNCDFSGCKAEFGGAVYLLRCFMDIDGCTFTNNIGYVDGGGAQTYASSGRLANSTFTNNRCAVTYAGSGSAFKAVGIKTAGAPVTLEDCTITGNTVPGAGAAVEYFENSKILAGTLRLIGTEIVANLQGSGTPNAAAGLRVIGSQAACVVGNGTTICGNTPRNVEGPFLAEGKWTVCDCLADVTNDGQVNAADLGIVLASWGAADVQGSGDTNHDGVVNGVDLSTVLDNWGTCE